MHDKAVIVLDPDDFYGPLWAYLDALREQGFVRQAALDVLRRVATIEDALALLP